MYNFINNMKTVISFDWDWTLWYPKFTKHKKAPHRIYEKFPSVEEANANLILIPWIMDILIYCKTKKITLILLSTNPNIPSIAQKQVEQRAELLWISKYFDFIISARDYPENKWEMLVDFAYNNKLDLNTILHIWDSYNRDYLSTKNKWIDSILIKTNYMKEDFPFAIEHKNLLKTIKTFIT